MPGVYTGPSLDTAVSQIAARLGDPGQVFWTKPELYTLVGDSLRTWQIYAGAYRVRDAAVLSAGQAYADLATLIPGSWTVSVTDQTLIDGLCDALQEPRLNWAVSPSVWAGSAMFTLDAVTQAIQRRRDQFLLETGLVGTHRSVPVASPPIGRQLLPQTVASVRHAAWVPSPSGSVGIPLSRIDAGAADTYAVGWVQAPGTPAAFSTLETPPLTLQLIPPPIANGSLDLVTLETGPTLAPSLGATVLGVPDDWVWVVKWGVLADLLTQTGIARDADRATYCDGRWNDGLMLGRRAVSVLAAEIDGVAVPTVDSLADWDRFAVDWMATGAPTGVALATPNLVAISPVPDAHGPYSLTLDLLGSIPVPTVGNQPLPVGGETLDVIYDYAAHLGAFKQGGQDFAVSVAQYQRFVAAARREQSRIRATALYADVLTKQAQRQTWRRPDRDQPQALPVGMDAA